MLTGEESFGTVFNTTQVTIINLGKKLMNKKIGSSILAAAAFTGLMSGLAFADDTAAGGTKTDSSTAAPAESTGKKAKKSKGSKHTCKASKSSCKSKSGCKASDASKTDATK
jgi:hypothetical protein